MSQKERVDEALKALGQLQPVGQSVGKWAMLASLCKPGSKLGEYRWQQYDNMNDLASELRHTVKVALRASLKP